MQNPQSPSKTRVGVALIPSAYAGPATHLSTACHTRSDRNTASPTSMSSEKNGRPSSTAMLRCIPARMTSEGYLSFGEKTVNGKPICTNTVT